MKLAKQILVSDPEQEKRWRVVLLYQKDEPELFVLCIHPEHIHPLEIMSTEEFYKADRKDPGYRVVGIADSYSAALSLVTQAVEASMKLDPSLDSLGVDLKEIYL